MSEAPSDKVDVSNLFDEDADESDDADVGMEDAEELDDNGEQAAFAPELIKSGFIVDESDKKGAKKRKRKEEEGLIFGSDSDSDSDDDSDDDSDADSDDDSDDSDDSGDDNGQPKLKRLRKTDVRGGNEVDADELALLRENLADGLKDVPLPPEMMAGNANGATNGTDGDNNNNNNNVEGEGESSVPVKKKKKSKRKREMEGFIVDETSSDESESDDDQDSNDKSAQDGEFTKQQMDMQDLFGIDDEHQIEALRRAQLRAQSSSGGGSFDQGQDDGMDVDDDDDNEDSISLANLAGRDNQKEIMHQIQAQYEPKARKDAFVGDVDETIRMTDVPERLQIRNRKLPTTGVEEEKRGEERYRESKWITGMLERNGLMMSFRNEDAVIQSVGHVLRCLKEEHLEIPFIYRYRSELFAPGNLEEDDLWKIYDFDTEWADLRSSQLKLKKNVQALLLSKKNNIIELNEKLKILNAQTEVDAPFIEPLSDASSSSAANPQSTDPSLSSTTTDTTDTTDTSSSSSSSATAPTSSTSSTSSTSTSSSSSSLELSKLQLQHKSESITITKLENVLVELDTITEEKGYDIRAAKYDAIFLKLKHTDLSNAVNTKKGRAKRADPYVRAINNGLADLIDIVGIDGDGLGENVDQRNIVHPLPSYSKEIDIGDLPLTDFVDSIYRDEESVRVALVSALAKKISTIRYIREFAERRVRSHLQIQTTPTRKGERLIAYGHEFFCVQSLRNKKMSIYLDPPSEDEERDILNNKRQDERLQYLILVRAENEKMIRVTYEGDHSNQVLSRLLEVGVDQSTEANSEINTVRRDAYKEAVERFCIPEAIHAVRSEILKKAREHLTSLCGENLRKIAALDFSNNVSQLDKRMKEVIDVKQTEALKKRRKTDKVVRNGAGQNEDNKLDSDDDYDDSDDEYSNMDGNNEYEKEGEGSGVSVGAKFQRDGCIYVPHESAKGIGRAVFIILNENGDMIDHQYLSRGEMKSIGDKNNANSEGNIKINQFLELHTPRRIVINTSGHKDSKTLKSKLSGLILDKNNELWNLSNPDNMIGNNDVQFDERGFEIDTGGSMNGKPKEYVGAMSCFYLDDTVASLFVRSALGTKMYSKYGMTEKSQSKKLAICLGRYVQSPLATICGLWQDRESSLPGGSLLTLPLHAMQQYLSRESLAKAYERVLLRATCAVGVDINRALKSDHLSTTLCFVPGLGVRKAALLLSTVKQTFAGLESNQQYIYQRENLRDAGFKSLMEPLLGERVFKNCSGFLTIHAIHGQSPNIFDPRAKTRIHPENYPLLDKLLVDVMQNSDRPSTSTSSSNNRDEKKREKWKRVSEMLAVCQKEPVLNPLHDLDMDEYAASIAKGHRDRDEKERLNSFGGTASDSTTSDSTTAANGAAAASSSSSSSSSMPTSGTTHVHVDVEESLRLRLAKEITYNKKKTLMHMISEMCHPCKEEEERLEVFMPYESYELGKEKMFTLLTGISLVKELSKYGDIVYAFQNPMQTAHVKRRIKNDQGMTKLLVDCCGTQARLEERDFDEGQMDDVTEGTVLEVYVKEVNVDKLFFNLSCKSEDIQQWNNKNHEPIPREPFWYRHVSAQSAQRTTSPNTAMSGQYSQRAQPITKKRPLAKRNIYEECFSNVSREDALKLLNEEEVGQVLFRPSSKGNDRVHATLKFFENTFSDYVILEEDKDKEDLKKLGSKLYVGERTLQSESKGDCYSSLEEIQFTYFNELMEHAELVTGHRKFLEGGRSIVESQCHDEISSNPTRCAYHFCVSTAHPGFFELGYITTKTFRYMYVQPEPKGLRCGKKIFGGDNSVGELMSEFKKGPHELYKSCQLHKQEHQNRMRKERAEKDKADREQAHREAQAYQQQSQQHQYGLYPPQQQQYQPQQQQQQQFSSYPQPQQQQYQQPVPGGYYNGGYSAVAQGAPGGAPPQQQQQPQYQQPQYNNMALPPAPQQVNNGGFYQPPPGQGGY